MMVNNSFNVSLWSSHLPYLSIQLRFHGTQWHNSILGSRWVRLDATTHGV